jgi:hypothetical protein
MRSPRFGVKNATDLLEIEHSFPYHSHRRGVKQLRWFLILLEAIGPDKGEHVSNLAGGTLTPQSPQCPGRAWQVNGSRDGFPPGDKFEGSGQSGKDKPERENPDVNIPPSAHEPYKSLKRFKLVDEFADSEINASFGKTVDAFSHATEAKPKARGSWPKT